MAYIGKQPANAPLTSADITDGIITNTDIAADAAIAQTKLDTLSISDSNIADGAISQAKLATLSISDSNIADGALAQAKISGLSTALSGKQPLDAGLTSISGLTTDTDKMIYTTAADTYAVADLTTAGRALLDDADAAAQRTTLGLSNFADLTADQTFTGGNRGTVTVANTASFDMDTTNNFSCTPTANYTITFTNITAGQSGNIYINNASAYTASKAASVKLGSADLATLSATGEYWLSYFAPSASVVLVSVTAALS